MVAVELHVELLKWAKSQLAHAPVGDRGGERQLEIRCYGLPPVFEG